MFKRPRTDSSKCSNIPLNPSPDQAELKEAFYQDPILTLQFQNSLDDYRETSHAIAAARKPVNSPVQIIVLVVVFGLYYAITRFLWIKAGDADGQLAWINMWIAIVAFGFTWLALSLPHSFRSRKFPWLTARQAIALGTFILLIASLIFQHVMSAKLSHHPDKLTWQVILPHSIWLTILLYVSTIAAHNHRSSLPRHWDNRPDLHRHQTAEISADGVSLSDTVSTRQFHWPAFTKSEETRNLFLLFQSDSIALMIPKRAFNSDEELNAMRHLVKLIPTHHPTGFEVAPLHAAA